VTKKKDWYEELPGAEERADLEYIHGSIAIPGFMSVIYSVMWIELHTTD
jgi:hypothetical protein